MTDHQRTGVSARSGDTHVIDGSTENAEAVNIDRAPAQPEAKPARRRAPDMPAGEADLVPPVTSAE